MTKLDGTARGGILVAIAEKFELPVHFIGVGEGVDDLEPFAARDFARAIAGLEKAHDGARTRTPETQAAAPRAHASALNPTLKLVARTRAAGRCSSSPTRKFGIFAATGVLMAGVLVSLAASWRADARICRSCRW